jgi:hypothetical protein
MQQYIGFSVDYLSQFVVLFIAICRLRHFATKTGTNRGEPAAAKGIKSKKVS